CWRRAPAWGPATPRGHGRGRRGGPRVPRARGNMLVPRRPRPHRESGRAARYTSSRGIPPVGTDTLKPRTNSEWVRELSAGGETQAAALEELRAYLLRAARYALARAHGRLTRARAFDLDQLAQACAQNALIAILDRLADC